MSRDTITLSSNASTMLKIFKFPPLAKLTNSLQWQNTTVFAVRVNHRELLAQDDEAYSLLKSNALPTHYEIEKSHHRISITKTQGRQLLSLPCIESCVELEREKYDGSELVKVENYAQYRGIYVPAVKTRQSFWHKYGLNLMALEAYACATATKNRHMREPLLTAEERKIARDYFPHSESPFSIGPYDGLVGATTPFDGGKNNLPEIELTDYYELEGIALLIGSLHRQLDFMKGRDASSLSSKKPALPLGGIVFSPVGKKELATVFYFEGKAFEPLGSFSLGGLKGKAERSYKAIFRLRTELHDSKIKISELTLENAKSDIPSNQKQNQDLIKKLKNTNIERVKDIREHYLYLLNKVIDSQRENILAKQRKYERLKIEVQEAEATRNKSDYTKVPSNLQKILPHMTVLPAGLNSDISEINKNPLNTAFINISRQAGYNPKPVQLKFALMQEDLGFGHLLQDVRKIFGRLKVDWILPVGYVGLCKLYQEAHAYDSKNDIKTYATDFWTNIRPQSKGRIRIKGLNGLLGEKLQPVELYQSLMHILRCINFDYKRLDNKKSATIYGIIQVSETGKDHRGHYVKWRFNPQLEALITGSIPSYMVVNSDAMFSYRSRQLYTAPALQMYLEYQIRCRAFKGLEKKDGALLTPDGDGITLGKLTEGIGLIKGPNERPKRLAKRLYAALDTIGEAGPIRDWKIQGRERPLLSDTKLEIICSDDYIEAYKLAGLKRNLSELNKQLEAPFAWEATRKQSKRPRDLKQKKR